MTPEKIIENLESIEKSLKEAQNQFKDSPEIETKKEQLRTVKRSIKQFNKKGIPVPDKMDELALSLKNEIESFNSSIPELDEIFDKILDLAILAGKMCGRAPRRALYLKNKENRGKTISSEILSKNLVKILREMGGSGRETEIFIRIEQILQTQLSDSDKECPKGRTPVWHTKLRKVRKNLIKDGILTPDSRRRKWTLIQ